MDPVLVGFLRGTALALSMGVVAGGAVYEQGGPLRNAVTVGVVAVAYQVISQLLPGGISVAVANTRAAADNRVPPKGAGPTP